MLAKEAFQSVCMEIAKKYEADGWKWLKSGNEMKKKSKNFTYSVSFYTSYSNISEVKVELYASFGISINKTKNGVWGLSTDTFGIPHGQLSWNVATEDMWPDAIREFTHWLETECFPVMYECENNLDAFVEKVVKQGPYPAGGYHASLDFVLQFGTKEQAAEVAKRYYFNLDEEIKSDFKLNYESLIHGGKAVSRYGELQMLNRSKFRTIIENQIMIDFDSGFEGMQKAPVRICKIDAVYDRAMEIYCEKEGVVAQELTEEQCHELDLYAGNHLGFFTAWLIQHDYMGEKHKSSKGVKQVKEEKMSGTEFLMDYCNSELWSDDVTDGILPFVLMYCRRSLYKDYIKWVLDDLCDLPMEFIGSWEDYHSFEPVLDKAYEVFCEKQNS